MNRRGFFGLLAGLPLAGFFGLSKEEPRVYYEDTDSIVANKSYFASKVEVLSRTDDEGRIFFYDINSSYPSSMTRKEAIALLNRLYGKHGVL